MNSVPGKKDDLLLQLALLEKAAREQSRRQKVIRSKSVYETREGVEIFTYARPSRIL